jgi:hypothetical protein
MNLYQKQVGVDRCKSVEKSEKECEELLDRLIEYVELNPTLLKCKGTVMTGLKGMLLFILRQTREARLI